LHSTDSISLPAFRLASSTTGMVWPAVQSPASAKLWAILFQLEQSQWWSAQAIQENQRRQLRGMLQHAYDSVPFYRKWLDDAGLTVTDLENPDAWLRLPILKRSDLQTAGSALMSTSMPADHGGTRLRVTGGSTGEPVQIVSTELNLVLWRAFNLRDLFWHETNFSYKVAAIRFYQENLAEPPFGARSKNWGSATADIQTGIAMALSIHSNTEQQTDWLLRENPDYFITYPSALAALALNFQNKHLRLSNLKRISTFGEVLEPAVRELCERVWQVPVINNYSSEEFGYLALQCPTGDHYHVQSENVLLEVVDDLGKPCKAGEIGRVIVTGLNNFAMPLLRYYIGDYAEVGEPCPCGRGLPVLNKILGRQRNMFTLPNGETRWPMIQASDLAAAFDELPPIAKFQLVQKTLEQLELKLVSLRSLSRQEELNLTAIVRRGLGYPFELSFNYVEDIPRTPRGKHEECRSEVSTVDPGTAFSSSIRN
jgi:phenylacetate-CoA ligase